MNTKALLGKASLFLKANSPEILMGLSLVGVGVTAALAFKAGMRCEKLIMNGEMPTEKKEMVVKAAKEFAPTLVAAAATTALIVGSHSAQTRKYLALAAAYEVSEDKLKKLKEKLPEFLGEKKAEETIAEAYKPENVKDLATINEMIVDTGKGKTIVYDKLSGRYFYSDVEKLRQAQNDINEQIIGDWSATLNEFYCCCGLDAIKLGDDLGWNTSNLLKLVFYSSLLSDGTPIVVMDYDVYPEYRLL